MVSFIFFILRKSVFYSTNWEYTTGKYYAYYFDLIFNLLISKLLGEPSTKSSFDTDVWIYIERKISTDKIYKLGKEKLLVNNVLVLEIDDIGLLADKKLYKKEDMNDLKFAENSTDPVYRKRSFVYDFLSSMRQKINDPLGKRKNK